VREKVAISYDNLGDALARLRSYVSSGIVLSTCNRTEVYLAGAAAPETRNASLEFLKAWSGLGDGLMEYVYVLEDGKAAEHLFRVAGGLESMIVGESEVLGQVKQALDASHAAGMVNLPLRHLFVSALRAGRRARAETGIGRNALSVSSVAVDFAAGIVGDLKKCSMLVIGTGEAGRLVAKVARDRGIKGIVIASRTRERASGLAAEMGAVPTDMDSLAVELTRSDIVVACTGAPHPVLEFNQVAQAMRRRPGSPLVVIDIAIPRNVEPDVQKISGVYLHNIDDLTVVSDRNRRLRQSEVRRAEGIIRAEAARFIQWWKQLEVRPAVSALMSRAERVRQAQLKRTLKKLPGLTEEQYQSLEAMTRSIVNKILKDPVAYLKSNGEGVDLVKKLFNLEADGRQ